ncbi:MAG TPA: 16S rRNA (cytidine(1402)-2'-O)-methyltransferase [Longimicrobiaceae bacterium]|nr:16S rRNA (cytidine(1402)-2'-O)-methyltransferase [Longimicrobiaceae bacterium]
MPALYVVSTPIGNLGDLSRRAIEILGAVDVILAEDTRRTGVLLKHFDIQARLISAHEHNEAARADLVVELLGEGKEVALVSDAGTPLVSDPGDRITSSAIAAGFDVIPIPGASALLAALVGSGLPAGRFTFYGFLPRKGGDRTNLLEELAASPYTCIIYESPNRLSALFRDLLKVTGPDRYVVVGREITKLHEEFYRATVGEAVEHFAGLNVRGEVVVVISGNTAPPEAEDESAARVIAEALLAQGLAPSAVARELRERMKISRNDAYQLVQELAAGEGNG